MHFRFSSFSDFMTMSGHGIYVWSAFFVVVASIAGLLIFSVAKRKKIKHDIREYYRRVELASQNGGDE